MLAFTPPCGRARLRLDGLAHAALLIGSCLGFNSGTARAELLYVSMSDSTIVTYNVSLGDATAVQGTRTTFASGSPLNAPEEMVFDAAGNLYTTNRNGNTVTKITPAGVMSTFASGTASLLNKPIGLAIDPSGNLYVANENGPSITKLTPAGAASTFASVGSYGLASDAAGNVYAAPGNTIVKYTPQGVSSTFANTNLNGPRGMTFDASGNLFVANFGNHIIAQFTTAGTGSAFVNTGGVGPNDVAFDSLGNLYVAANGTRAIHKYNATGVFQFSWSTGGPRTQHLAFVPVPEPSTYGLAAVGAAGLLALHGSRRGGSRLRGGHRPPVS
jgi:sugar lactone lactonase YvrE